MRALVTGAAGFVGSRLSLHLRNEAWDVIGLDSFTNYYDVKLKRANAEALWRAGVSVIEGDLNVIDLSPLLSNVDVVFHLAGQPGVRASWGTEFTTYTYSNIDATQRLLEASRDANGLARLVYASSSSVYGNAEQHPTKEDVRPQPISPYGVTKLAAEHLCSLYATNFGISTVSLRYFTVYGPGQRPDMAFTRFANAAVRGEEITVYGSGEQTRDFTYIDDVVQANVLAATTQDVPPGTVLNVAGGSHASVNEVLQIFQELSDSSLLVNYENAMVGDAKATSGDTTAIRTALGWRPTVTLRDGIARQFDWAASSLQEVV